MARPRSLILLLGVVSIGYAAARHLRHGSGHQAPGGILIGDAGIYDKASRVLLGSFYRGIADDLAAVASSDERILEIGCGPGHLAIELAARGLDVRGVDLDPAMIERARANTQLHRGRLHPQPSFDVADVASLPHANDSFDLVVSTLSLHHWADPVAAMTEIARVLRPAGRALIWDLGPGRRLLHGHLPDPASHLHDSPLQLVEVERWRWPLRFTPIRRMEFARPVPED